MALPIVNDSNFQSEVLEADLPVLVDFYADWCGPCKMVAPVVEKVAGAYSGKLKVVKLNTDESPQTAMNYQVRSIPTLILFRGGQPVSKKVGYVPEAELTRFIEETLSQPTP
ncbi:MAG TPA: thioredoxin [Candidatus Nitrosotenuis sp.]|jgi:thioredoxin 1|nr:thioredoxin [Candidatus Nitrosotenuis sp.]